MSKHRSKTALIVEGEKREVKYLENLKKNFFPKKDVKILTLPACENIYMLWKQMKEDDFETDIIEVLREYSPLAVKSLQGLVRTDFQEVYLFFDYEAQQENLSDKDKSADEIIQEMLEQFSNETENGKLYISYPMCEALRDINHQSCMTFTDCFISLERLHDYKKDSAEGNVYANVSMFELNEWKMILNIFLARLKCIFKKHADETELLKWYKTEINTTDILCKEKTEHIQQKRIFVLSAFPEFILDYFTLEYITTLLSEQEKISLPQCAYNKL